MKIKKEGPNWNDFYIWTGLTQPRSSLSADHVLRDNYLPYFVLVKFVYYVTIFVLYQKIILEHNGCSRHHFENIKFRKLAKEDMSK